ncbi:MAG: hypothetical protein KAU35_01285 [candidate division Zixibacteria bacterium]|nr:hypothetical protein [candidate division Zixibacteria bacterium]
MSEFGKAAVRAERKRLKDKKLTPVEAWEWAINQSNLSDSSKKKCCPKFAYIGVCEQKDGDAPDGNKNKNYAREAVNILKTAKPSSAAALWRQVTANLKCEGLTHNDQMGVVLALKDAGYI